MNKIHSYDIPHGVLYLYGGDLQMCLPYIKGLCNSVEGICLYCQQHNILIYHKPNFSVFGFFEIFRVGRLTTKYSVRGTKKGLYDYVGIKWKF